MTSLYVIGDIHGMYESLHRLILKIAEHRQQQLNHTSTPAELVFVGDYIDRGPDSMNVLLEVIDLVRNVNRKPRLFSKVVALKGNHEDLMLCSYDNDIFALHTWLDIGGVQTLESFDTTVDGFFEDIDPAIIKFMRDMPTYYEAGKVCIAHAGLSDPSLKASEHDYDDLIWSRNHLHEPHDHYKFIVHGHTPQEKMFMNDYAANIDTGAVFGGTLTCLFIGDADDPLKVRQVLTT